MKAVSSRRLNQRGFMLLFVFLMAASAALAIYLELPRVAFESQRMREEMLVDRGLEYRRAIQLYTRKLKRYPQNLDDLEKNGPNRFLRRRYVDPMTGKDEWRLIKIGPDGQLLDSLVHKPKNPLESEKKGLQNTFITEQASIGSTGINNGPGQTTVGNRLRQSDMAGAPGQQINPQSGPVEGAGVGPNGEPLPPPDPNNPNAQQPNGQQPNQQPGFLPQQGFVPPQGVQGQQQQPGFMPQQGFNPQQQQGSNPQQQPGFNPQQQQPGFNPQQQPGFLPQQQTQPGAVPQQGFGQPQQPQPQQYGFPQQTGQPPVGFPAQPGQTNAPVGYNPMGQIVPGVGTSTNLGQRGGYTPNATAANEIMRMITQPRPGGQPGSMNTNPYSSVSNSQTGGTVPQQMGGGTTNTGISSNPGFGQGQTSFGQNTPGRPNQGAMPGLGAGIAGVASKFEAEGIKVFAEKTRYNEWEFIYDAGKDPLVVGPVGTGPAPAGQNPGNTVGTGSSFGTGNRGNSSFGNTGFGNSGFGNSGFGNSGFGNSGLGNSGTTIPRR